MLQVGVHYAQNRGVGVLPTVKNGSRQSSLAFADQDANAGIFTRNAGNNFFCSVAAVVVDHNDFVTNADLIEHRADVVQNLADIFCFAEGRDRQCQLIACWGWSRVREQLRCLPVNRHVRWFNYHGRHAELEYTRFTDLKHKLSGNLLLLLCFTLLGFAVMGYHPGAEDDGIYLSAVKSDLNPGLYPKDAEFFRLQVEGTLFDESVSGFVRLTHIPVAVTSLVWQLVSVGLVIFACSKLAQLLFKECSAQWAGVALVSAMLTLPVSGTALYLMDQHLHARNVATALILLAVWRVMAKKRMQALIFLLASFLMHPIMAAAGLSFCFFLTLAMSDAVHERIRSLRNGREVPTTVAAALPLWIFEKPSPIWEKALNSRTYYFLYKWTWYEWLGAVAPLFLFWVLWRKARQHNHTTLARFALAVFVYGAFQQVFAMAVLAPAALVRLTPLQPMRYLQLVYFFLALIGGCLLGKYFLKASVWRWALFLLATNGCMFAAQRAEFPASEHLELPGRSPSNSWVQAFAWIRKNTPTDAYFALDPRYLEAPEEDNHSFRALAERSQLCDDLKDTAVVTQVPELAPKWDREVEAQSGWHNFKLADFKRLKHEFGVNWTLVSYPEPKGLDCQWHNDNLAVCRIP
jgi:hypothetical protein